METFQQPIINDFRQLSEGEANLINQIKDIGAELEKCVEDLKSTTGLDQRWVSIGQTQLQQGLMALVRAVAKPESF